MQFGVLGPVRVATGDEEPATVTGPLRAGLLALLLARANAPIGADRLLDALWGDTDPAGLSRLHTGVHKLRRLLDDPDRLRYDAGGYRLRVGPGELDADRFETLVAAAAAAAPEQRAALLREADALWRGTPFQGLDLGDLAGPAQRLEESRSAALEDLHAAELACGRHHDVLAELTDLAARYPLRERLQVLLMTAQFRCGRVAEALAVHRRARDVVVGELGLEPGPELREAQRRALAGLDPLTGAAGGPRSGPPAQLPGAPDDFVGRATELADLEELAARARLVVVSGGAGVGKTALVARWAGRSPERFVDGVLHVDLQGFGPQDPVPATTALGGFLRALGDDVATAPPGLEERAARFRTLSVGRRLLVVLDNAATAEQVRPLLAAGTSCVTVVTSRDRLDGLAVGEGAHRLDVGAMSTEDAHALLAARLGDATPDADRCARIARLCAHLPLALRIVAERLRAPAAPPVDRVVAELADEQGRLDVLDTGDAPTSVRATLSWSYRRLAPPAARMFRLCGFRCPHPGHLIDLPGSAALAGTGDVRAVRRWLDDLVRCGLVEERPGPRYAMHDLVRLYAAELAAEEEPESGAGPRLVGHILHTAVHAAGFVARRETGLLTADPPPATVPRFAHHGPALDWLDAHRANLYCAADLAGRHGSPSVTVDLAISLWPYLDLGGHLEDSRRLHTLARAAVRELDDDRAEAIVLRALGLVELRSGRSAAAVARLREAAARHGDDPTGATTTVYLAAAEAAAGRPEHAVGLADDRLLDTAPATALVTLGRCLLGGAQVAPSLTVLRRATAAAGHGPLAARALRSLAEACRAGGADDEADAHTRRADVLAGAGGGAVPNGADRDV